MKHTAAVVISLVLLFLGSPLLAQEGLAPQNEGTATESLSLPFLNQADQTAPLQCATPAPVKRPSMTARECAETCGGCCECRQFVTKCVDWQCC